jgi:threonine/homoserine/homoserine lactone efflux protein
MNISLSSILLYPSFIPLLILLFVGNFTPGPNNIIASYSGFHFGYRKTFPHVLGVTFGWPSLVLAVNFGLAIIFTKFPIFQKVIEVLGSFFLIYLAYTLIQIKKIIEKEVKKPLTFLTSFFFQFVNPKGVVTATIVVSQFITNKEYFFRDTLIVVICTLISAFLSISTWALFGKYLRTLLSSKLSNTIFNYSMASLLVLIVVLFWIS